MAHNEEPNAIVTERIERRVSEECGKLRVEMAEMRGDLRTDMAGLRGDMRTDMSGLRAEMVRGNTALLKWLLVYFVTQTAATAAFIRLLI